MRDPDDAPAPRVIEPEPDEDIRLPNMPHMGRAAMVSMSVIVMAAATTFALLQLQVAPVRVGLFVFTATLLAPLLAALIGNMTLDRAVPFGGALSVIAIIVFAVAIEYGSAMDFYPGRGSAQGGLLWLLTFAGLPVASIVGAVLGCVLAKRRRERNTTDDASDNDEFLL